MVVFNCRLILDLHEAVDILDHTTSESRATMSPVVFRRHSRSITVTPGARSGIYGAVVSWTSGEQSSLWDDVAEEDLRPDLSVI